MFTFKFPTRHTFWIFRVLKIDEMAPFCS